ncbi:hypothetical protein AKJ47_02005 [candidate division MSBL1 archaeon SCGC-AAA261G05]|uniref:Uncharacterized protein n=1 Tax=candidate division MSBL1 archaeon SCGC-AAA261G05 TaxID=1698276 RepID=A0A133VAW7_9EURY|nr:hypothetical protein AKJ47_02005 [candidate division MSBL1 archaeon SCGC-AAA261G05]
MIRVKNYYFFYKPQVNRTFKSSLLMKTVTIFVTVGERFEDFSEAANGIRQAGLLKVSPHFFHPYWNSNYGSHGLANKIINMCKDNSSTERYSNPSPDTILRRLHQVDETEFWKVLTDLNESLLQNIRLPKDSMIALDFMIIPWYGKEQPSLVSDSRLLEQTLESNLQF